MNMEVIYKGIDKILIVLKKYRSAVPFVGIGLVLGSWILFKSQMLSFMFFMITAASMQMLKLEEKKQKEKLKL